MLMIWKKIVYIKQVCICISMSTHMCLYIFVYMYVCMHVYRDKSLLIDLINVNDLEKNCLYQAGMYMCIYIHVIMCIYIQHYPFIIKFTFICIDGKF
jgi:hypothetical protein